MIATVTNEESANTENNTQTDQPLTKHERRLARHQARKEARLAPPKRTIAFKPQKRTIFTMLPITLLVGGVVAFALTQQAKPLAGTKYSDLGREHISLGDSHVPYNSNPATSGPHAPAARWGVYTSPIADEQLVHNLEHGGIVITYQPSISEADRSKLEGIANSFSPVGVAGITPVILAPREKNDRPVSVSAWTWAQSFDGVDEAGIKNFYNDHVGKAPEPIQ